MSNLTLAEFDKILSKLDALPPLPAGITYNPRAYDSLRRAGQKMQYNFDFPDFDQQEDCLVFYDNVILRAYLERKAHPEAYIDALRRKTNGEPKHLRLRKWLELTGQDVL